MSRLAFRSSIIEILWSGAGVAQKLIYSGVCNCRNLFDGASLVFGGFGFCHVAFGPFSRSLGCPHCRFSREFPLFVVFVSFTVFDGVLLVVVSFQRVPVFEFYPTLEPCHLGLSLSSVFLSLVVSDFVP